MGCQYYEPGLDGKSGGASNFSIAIPRLTFGRGCLKEIGERAANRNFKRVALFTDKGLQGGGIVDLALESLKDAGIDVAVFADIVVEPTDACAERGAAFLSKGSFDGLISVGGGSVIDTAKSALLLHKAGGKLQRFFAPPVGEGAAINGPLLPHIACPTTSGTGSECTSMSVIRVVEYNTKFVVGSPLLLPDEALIDPACADSLLPMNIASTGYDLTCHALECFTAKPYSHHAMIEKPGARQLIQGANPWSELIASKAMQIADEYLVRGVNDRSDREANDQLMWGATLAGMAFGNTGTHMPHALSYGITHLMDNITTPDYDVPAPFIPHGVSVMLMAPSVFRYTAAGAPERHMQAAEFLGADTNGALAEDAGEIVATRLIKLMKETRAPNGLQAAGFADTQTKALAASAFRQQRAIANAPRESNLVDVENIFANARNYW